MSEVLQKSLNLKDLVFFGIASIIGSGGFNLVGDAISKGGTLWPVALAGSGAVFYGASKAYETAFQVTPKNIAESELVKKELGEGTSTLSIIAILLFNILSISTILVYCSHMLFPEGKWLGQISFAIFLLFNMTYLSLKGIDVNKEIINTFVAFLIVFLSVITMLGFAGFASKPTQTLPLPDSHSFATSLLLFYFILAGFDALIKFTEETKDKKDIPRSFYVSNFISFFLVVGLSLAFVTFVNVKDSKAVDNSVGYILQHFLGGSSAAIVKNFAIFYLILTTFVVFLGTSRYMFSLGSEYDFLSILKGVNETKAPSAAIFITTLIAAFGILINHTDTLVRISDFALSVMLLLVSAAAAKFKYDKGEMPWVEGLTSVSFAGLMGISFL